MKIIIPRKVDKYLKKQRNGDLKGISKVMQFLDSYLSKTENPTLLPNCKKMQGTENNWRWRVGNYRIIAEVKKVELIIFIIEISTRENAY